MLAASGLSAATWLTTKIVNELGFGEKGLLTCARSPGGENRDSHLEGRHVELPYHFTCQEVAVSGHLQCTHCWL